MSGEWARVADRLADRFIFSFSNLLENIPVASPLDFLPIWLLVACITGSVLLAIEVGFRLGKFRRRVGEAEASGLVGTIIGATLGLLAFMLAFTFGLAASRFEERRQLVVQEANAIGTTFLRAGLLSESQASKIRDLLAEYVRARLEVVKTGDFELVLERSAALHRTLWAEAEEAGGRDGGSIKAALFIEALNAMIDIHSERVLVGLRSRLPVVLWAAFFLLTGFSMAGVGYHIAVSNSPRSPAILVMVLSFMIVITLIVDLDRPQEGLLSVNQEAMVNLLKTMEMDLE